MGLSFQVGDAATIFERPFADKIVEEVKRKFDVKIPLEEKDSPYFCSEEVGWSWWNTLQKKAQAELGIENVRHLLSVDAWLGIYLPADIEPNSFFVSEKSKSWIESIVEKFIKPKLSEFNCASLFGLKKELQNFAGKMNLPTEEEELKELQEKYLNDDLVNSDEEIQTYIQLMLVTKFAVKNNYPLWIVK
jgi:hypothetical protein